MFGGKGFYIALAVCLLAAGTIGYITLFSSASPVREPDPVIEIKPAPVTPVPAPPTKPVIRRSRWRCRCRSRWSLRSRWSCCRR